MRDTIQKRLVKKVVLELCHPSADQVYAKVKEKRPDISRRTVYRNLNLLVEQRQLQKIYMPNGADCFDFTLEPHHHIRCEVCGSIFDVDMPAAEHLEQRIRDTHGFLIRSYDVVFTGICPECRKRVNKEEMKDE